MVKPWIPVIVSRASTLHAMSHIVSYFIVQSHVKDAPYVKEQK